MDQRCISTSNKERAVNSPERVFGGWVCGGLGNFAPGRRAPGADRRGAAGDSDRLQRLAIGAGSCGSGPASISQNQRLSAMRVAVVARMPSHRAFRMALSCRFGGLRRLIACLPTGSSWIAIGLGGAAGLGQRPRGAVPPFGPRLVSDARSGHRAGNLEKSARVATVPLAHGLGRQGAAAVRSANICRRAMGSGVQPARERKASGAKIERGGNRVGVKRGFAVHGEAVALGDSAVTVGGARG